MNAHAVEPHPSYVLAGTDLDELITAMEAGTFRLPSVPVWRNDLPLMQAARLAQVSGIARVHAGAHGARPVEHSEPCGSVICMTVEEYVGDWP